MLSFQFFVKIGIVGHYLLNKEYISKVLCINKDKPSLNCEGRCQLKKKLNQQNEQENKLPSSVKEIVETVLFSTPIESLSLTSFFKSLDIVTPTYAFSCINAYQEAIFQPPQR